MDRILLDITGVQRIDGQSDKIQLTTMGTLRDDGTAYIVKYTEEQAPPVSPVKVTVRIQKDKSAAGITRSGAIDTCLLIERSKRNLCHYNTEFGDILMGIYGKDIEIEHNGESGSFFFSYDIDVNGSLASKNSIDIEFKINRNSENTGEN